MTWLPFHCSLQCSYVLLEGGVYFVGKLADSIDDWNRYIWAIQKGMIDTGSSTHSLSLLLSAVWTSLRTQTGLEIAQWALAASISIHICAPCTLVVATIHGVPFLFCSELPIVRLLFEDGDYSKAVSNQRNTVESTAVIKVCTGWHKHFQDEETSYIKF